MAIYTRTGDGGNTALPAGGCVRKSDVRIAAVGTIDELNSHLGLCIQAASAAEATKGGSQAEVVDALGPLQAELMAAGALVAGSAESRLDESAVARMEGQIDQAWGKLPRLTHFIMPGGCELACRLHVARAVCRRAEREIVSAADQKCPVGPEVIRYFNRLGDLLFAMARLANFNAGVKETIWNPGGCQ